MACGIELVMLIRFNVEVGYLTAITCAVTIGYIGPFKEQFFICFLS